MQRINEFLASDAQQKPFCAVIGFPVSHSLSPLMHMKAIEYHGLQLTYHALEVAPEELHRLSELMNASGFTGANVTLPHKQTVLAWLSRIDPVARRVQAVNTIVADDDGGFTGYNTDIGAFMKPLRVYEDRLSGSHALVYGTGGAASAVLAGLELLDVEHIYVVSRNPENAQEALKEFHHLVTPVDYTRAGELLPEVSIVVNTTPLGMTPHKQQSPVPEELTGRLIDTLCYDIVYNPLKTVFLQQAEQAGGIPIDGLDMFIGQGEDAFYLWTGKTFPQDSVRKELEKKLAS